MEQWCHHFPVHHHTVVPPLQWWSNGATIFLYIIVMTICVRVEWSENKKWLPSEYSRRRGHGLCLVVMQAFEFLCLWGDLWARKSCTHHLQGSTPVQILIATNLRETSTRTVRGAPARKFVNLEWLRGISTTAAYSTPASHTLDQACRQAYTNHMDFLHIYMLDLTTPTILNTTLNKINYVLTFLHNGVK